MSLDSKYSLLLLLYPVFSLSVLELLLVPPMMVDGSVIVDTLVDDDDESRSSFHQTHR